MGADDLFAYARSTADLLGDRGVVVTQRDELLEIDLRALGALELFATEDGAYFRFGGPRGELRVILAAAAFFTLRSTLR